MQALTGNEKSTTGIFAIRNFLVPDGMAAQAGLAIDFTLTRYVPVIVAV